MEVGPGRQLVNAALWLGSLLLGKGKRFAGLFASGALLAIAGLTATLFIRGCVADHKLDELRDERDLAREELGACVEINAQNLDEINAINIQAARNEMAAVLQREAAEQAAEQARRALEGANARHEQEITELREAVADDDCAGLPVPDDVDGLWRRESPGDRPR